MKPRFIFMYSVILTLILILMSGCDLLTGNSDNIFIPNPDPANPYPDTENGYDKIPIVDGFDFPVGDQNGQGWAVTGYTFLQWSNYSNSLHPGEDWNMLGASMSDWGKPVYSIGHGLVIFSGWNTAQGNIIQIEHYLPNGSKVWSQYAHLEQRNVEQGEIVGRRQIIGTVGRGPNNAFSPHLHFEIRKQYLPQNAWPKTNGAPWDKTKVLEYYLPPTEFINQNRP
ncbi:MAG: M23 family metallopeptidase [Firmicutes bacterium]|nr:M23 family metallopeptidase [Bacillota bacterium]